MAKKESKTADREIKVSRVFNAPIDLVWEVWTNPEHIKNWWGPNGFTSSIQLMDVKKDGEWNLVMHGPDGTDYPNESFFREVVQHKKLVYEHVSWPKFTATVEFEKQGEKTFIEWQMLFASHEELVEVVRKHHADEGIKQNVEKLDHYLQTQLSLWKKLKTTTGARVCTYLNFPGNTEEAFGFYKEVFGTEFAGDGIQRFGDIPAPEGMPPLSEADKKLIIHVELPILGGHVLMATDAAESMGLKLSYGNNMHINLEPASKAETQRLYKALSEGGKITMELQDMFWGAYYGSCTDKFGINWMFNYSEK